jgi:hypothetical protein
MYQGAVNDLLIRRYRDVHAALPALNYPEQLVVGDRDRPMAALGYRLAGQGPLFLEQYLDVPVEALVADRLGSPTPRATIVEIGDHAADNGAATIRLWAHTAATLGATAEVAVAVLTLPLRAMFARIGIDIVELAPAHRDRLKQSGVRWGRYYDSDPVVCAGKIADGRDRLGSWLDGRAGRAA